MKYKLFGDGKDFGQTFNFKDEATETLRILKNFFPNIDFSLREFVISRNTE